MPDAVDTRCRMHRLDPGVIVTRACGSCGESSSYRLTSCTVCQDFQTLMPAEPPRMCPDA